MEGIANNSAVSGRRIIREGGDKFRVESSDGKVLFRAQADHELNIYEIKNLADSFSDFVNEEGHEPEIQEPQQEEKGFFSKLYDKFCSFFD